MNLINLVQAKAAMERLTEKRFTDFKIARKLVKMRKKVEAEAEFYTDQQKKAIEAYAELSPDGTPVFIDQQHIKLKNEDSKMAFDAEMQKLNNTEVDGIEPVTLTEADFCSVKDIPTPSDMIALEGIVEFAD